MQLIHKQGWLIATATVVNDIEFIDRLMWISNEIAIVNTIKVVDAEVTNCKTDDPKIKALVCLRT